MYLIEPEADALRAAIQRALEVEHVEFEDLVLPDVLQSRARFLLRLMQACDTLDFRAECNAAHALLQQVQQRITTLKDGRGKILNAMLERLRNEQKTPTGLVAGYSGDFTADLDLTILTLEAELRQVA